MIVASVYAAGATDFYSHDANARTLAQIVGMSEHDLPDIERSMLGGWLAADIKAGEDIPPPNRPLKGKKKKKKKS
jgi:hypothetical protein